MKNELYSDYIRSLPCVITNSNFKVAAHHTGGTTHRYTGLSKRNFDYAQIPINNDLHMQLHEIGESKFWKGFNISPTKTVINLMNNYCIMNDINLDFDILSGKTLKIDERKTFIENLGKEIHLRCIENGLINE